MPRKGLKCTSIIERGTQSVSFIGRFFFYCVLYLECPLSEILLQYVFNRYEASTEGGGTRSREVILDGKIYIEREKEGRGREGRREMILLYL